MLADFHMKYIKNDLDPQNYLDIQLPDFKTNRMVYNIAYFDQWSTIKYRYKN